MHTNISYQRNERTRRDARRARTAVAAKPSYSGKQWQRTSDKRAEL